MFYMKVTDVFLETFFADVFLILKRVSLRFKLFSFTRFHLARRAKKLVRFPKLISVI